MKAWLMVLLTMMALYLFVGYGVYALQSATDTSRTVQIQNGIPVPHSITEE